MVTIYLKMPENFISAQVENEEVQVLQQDSATLSQLL
jgi:hypothetical protein